MRSIEPAELQAWLTDAGREPPLVLDVREDWEVQLASLAGAIHIPMSALPARAGELDPERSVVCLCHHGVRSMRVAAFLKQQGFTKVHNLTGGIDAWSRSVDPAVPLY
jgi:rhodanese-related sulfurtransferase